MMENTIKHGDIVRWREEWILRDEERDMLYVACEPVYDNDSVYIKPLHWDNGPYVPAMLTRISYLERA